MSYSEYRKILQDVLSDVLEKQAFMFLEDGTDVPVEYHEEGIGAGIAFNGEKNGEINIYVSKSTAIEISANIIGEDVTDDYDINNAIDSIKEIINVVCGNFLTRLGNEDAEYNITIPNHQQISMEEWSGIISRDSCSHYVFDDHLLLLDLVMMGD